MRRINKHPEPEWLTRNAEAETRAYIEAPADAKPSPWRNPAVVNALKSECLRKCIYCESFIDGPAYSAVEHIRPKGFFEQLVLAWDNLGLVCTRCNTNKGNYWTNDEELALLNPYVDDIEAHIEFKGPLTVAILGSERGQNTIRRMKFLSREDLLLLRMRRIEELDSRLRLWHAEIDPERKALYAEDVSDAVGDGKEFSAGLRAYARSVGFPVDAN